MSSAIFKFIANAVLHLTRLLSEIFLSTCAGQDNHSAAAAAADSEGSEAEQESNKYVTLMPPPPSGLNATLLTPQSSTGSPSENLAGLSLSMSRETGDSIPQDDGMSALRSRIHQINSLQTEQATKAKLIHEVLLQGYRASRPHMETPSPGRELPAGDASAQRRASAPVSREPPKSCQNGVDEFAAVGEGLLTEADLSPTYAPVVPSDVHRPLGCAHYERNVKLQCPTCTKWYACRFCHDAEEDHKLAGHATRRMLCMLCGTPQNACKTCVHCGETAARYYCGICKLWESRKSRPIYHCSECGICRRGHGLGKDFFHCKTCWACIATSAQGSHTCVERSTDCDCPICGEYMFTSPEPVVSMACGHSIHKGCYDQYMRVSYKCPICRKSLANMETRFRNLDLLIQTQPMPVEFRNTKAVILCNDCSGKCTVPYHWLALKCIACLSYNTVRLQIVDRNAEAMAAASSGMQDSQPGALGYGNDIGGGGC